MKKYKKSQQDDRMTDFPFGQLGPKYPPLFLVAPSVDGDAVAAYIECAHEAADALCTLIISEPEQRRNASLAWAMRAILDAARALTRASA
jgi:hypothetical protein